MRRTRLAVTFLRTTQNGDGGWGSGESSNALNTAFALLALAHAHQSRIAGSEEVRAVSRGLAYLHHAATPDGTWPDDEFIRMDTGRATGSASQIVSYGSRTITTAFVVKSLSIWDRLLAEQPAEPTILA
jgi:squalene-hopene/tetraprenyl-beta-curcumene cyclase